MSRLTSLLSVMLAVSCVGFQAPMPLAHTCVSPLRVSTPLMMAKGKIKGNMGQPGNKGMQNAQGGMTRKGRAKFDKDDFQKSEWTLVAEKDELGEATGSTKAVAAGQSPQGQEYVWTLVRGDPVLPAGEDGEAPESTCYVTDGSCRVCLFPMTNAEVTKEGDGYAMTCGLCGTKYSLDRGEVLDFLPGSNPVQWMAKKANEKKEPQPCTVLRTRISKAGRMYVRLTDGTLPITTRRVEGTINEREEIAPKKR